MYCYQLPMSNLLQFHPLQFERNGQHLIEDLHLKYKPRLMLTKKNTEICEKNIINAFLTKKGIP